MITIEKAQYTNLYDNIKNAKSAVDVPKTEKRVYLTGITYLDGNFYITDGKCCIRILCGNSFNIPNGVYEIGITKSHIYLTPNTEGHPDFQSIFEYGDTAGKYTLTVAGKKPEYGQLATHIAVFAATKRLIDAVKLHKLISKTKVWGQVAVLSSSDGAVFVVTPDIKICLMPISCDIEAERKYIAENGKASF